MPSAQHVHWAKFRVSAVSLAAVAILSVLVYLLTGGTLLEQKTAVYLYIPDATGLEPGSPVRVDGISVGKVRSVSLSGSNEPNRIVKVTMTVDLGRLASIPDDSSAQTASDTLIGDKFVDITSGTSAGHIHPDGEIGYKGSPELLKSLDLGQFQERVRVVDALLTDIEQGRNRVGQFVVGEQMYEDLRKRITELQSGIRAASTTTSRVGRAVYTDRLYGQIHKPLAELDRSLARLESGQGSAGQFLRDSGQYEKLRNGAEDLRRSIADLRAGEFVQSDRLYSDWNRRVASLIESVDALNTGPMLSTSQAYDNLNGFAKELRDAVRDFRQNPRKFLRMKLF
jgi:phospholipid/cholesterol/gamma-HCH transport system substrate-binding protein